MAYHEFDGLGSEELISLLSTSIQEACRKNLSWTTQEKEFYLSDGFYGSPSLESFAFEQHTAEILEKLKQGGLIANWLPTGQSSTLDHLKVDFIVIRTGTEKAIGLQVTSDANKARLKRREMKKLYGGEIIGILHYRIRRDKLIEDQEMEGKILAAIYDEGLLAVDIKRPPEKEAEPLFTTSS